ncbi:MAG: hypothetical protein AAF483_16405 [Planctomycetota bacterium]
MYSDYGGYSNGYDIITGELHHRQSPALDWGFGKFVDGKPQTVPQAHKFV